MLPVVADCNVPPLAIVTLPPTVSVRIVVASNCRIPEVPWPTVTLRATAAVSTVTVAPSAMVTSSAAVGTTPPTQVAVLLQRPPAPVETMTAAGAWGRAAGACFQGLCGIGPRLPGGRAGACAALAGMAMPPDVAPGGWAAGELAGGWAF